MCNCSKQWWSWSAFSSGWTIISVHTPEHSVKSELLHDFSKLRFWVGCYCVWRCFFTLRVSGGWAAGCASNPTGLNLLLLSLSLDGIYMRAARRCRSRCMWGEIPNTWPPNFNTATCGVHPRIMAACVCCCCCCCCVCFFVMEWLHTWWRWW